jgi:hypothetical protein
LQKYVPFALCSKSPLSRSAELTAEAPFYKRGETLCTRRLLCPDWEDNSISSEFTSPLLLKGDRGIFAVGDSPAYRNIILTISKIKIKTEHRTKIAKLKVKKLGIGRNIVYLRFRLRPREEWGAFCAMGILVPASSSSNDYLLLKQHKLRRLS